MLLLSACQKQDVVKPVSQKELAENSVNYTQTSSSQSITNSNNTNLANGMSVDTAGGLIQKVDNFFVIVDASSSVNDDYLQSKSFGVSQGTKFIIEKELLKRINTTIPKSLKLSSGIRSFGYGECLAWQETNLIQSLTRYTKSDFAEKADKLSCASGGSPAASALHALNIDLAQAKGTIAIIMVSDGNFSEDLPFAEVEKLKNMYADNVCIYPIWTGNLQEPNGRDVLDRLTDAAECGFVVNAADISSNQAMVDYVHEVFYRFPHRKKAKRIIIADSDHDGVMDNNDNCPNTPEGATVNTLGCWIIKGIKFDTDKSDIKPEYFHLLDNIVEIINKNPQLQIEIQGHTDSIASAEYNLKLSQRRASSVLLYLENHGVQKDVLRAKGYGLSHPVDTNANESGRAKNRRVELKILK